MCGETLLSAVIVERRNGPRRLDAIDNNDDNDVRKSNFTMALHRNSHTGLRRPTSPVKLTYMLSLNSDLV